MSPFTLSAAASRFILAMCCSWASKEFQAEVAQDSAKQMQLAQWAKYSMIKQLDDGLHVCAAHPVNVSVWEPEAELGGWAEA